MKKIEVGCDVMFLENEQIEDGKVDIEVSISMDFLAAAGSTCRRASGASSKV